MELGDEEDAERRRALLLHYISDKVYDIYQVHKGESENTYDGVKGVLTNYFKPRKNTQIEIYNFRTFKQKEGQSIDEYVTELLKLIKECEFADCDKEILSTLIQNCSSNRLRRRALQEPDKGLADIVALVRAMEMSNIQAQTMENSHSVNAVKQRHPKQKHDKDQRTEGTGSRKFTKQKKSNTKCWNCGGTFPHREKPCPAKG
ncbi:uncharacterized protein [Argopecten irradians]